MLASAKYLSVIEIHIPVDVAELVFSQASLQANCDIKCSAGRDGTTHTRHGDDRNVFNLNVSGRLGDEDQALIQEVEETLVRLDGALDSTVTVMAVGCQ